MRGIEKLVTDLLEKAISQFGEPISDWNFTKLEITDEGPCLLYYDNTGEVSISLSKAVIDDNFTLIFQLSHEICHLLHPSTEFPSLFKNDTLNINEGISTYFSVLMLEHFYNAKQVTLDSLKNDSKENKKRDYYKTYLLVEELLSIDQNAIKKLRNIQPRIDKLTPFDFTKVGIAGPEKLIESLLTKFE